ncbi:hypothetical protein PUN28_002038 [Cardiocondyla obscurior]|uniref:Uncharacterized protein n=1 Tax=Cardiocondyla obscurior TaxID=286306 RepID=A0AAW2GSH7_9HYME
MDGTRNFPSQGFAEAQPTVSDDKAWISHLTKGRIMLRPYGKILTAFGCAIILHPTRINQLLYFKVSTFFFAILNFLFFKENYRQSQKQDHGFQQILRTLERWLHGRMSTRKRAKFSDSRSFPTRVASMLSGKCQES